MPLAASERGAVDTVVNSEHRTGDLLLERLFGGNARAFLGGNYYQEARQNGTILQVNSADLRQLRTGVDFTSRKLGSFGVRLFGGTESLWQTFSSVSADRNSEVLTRYQTVPVSQMGSSVLWSRTGRQPANVAGGRGHAVGKRQRPGIGLHGGNSHGKSQQWRLATHDRRLRRGSPSPYVEVAALDWRARG